MRYTMQEHGVNRKTMVVQPKEGSRLMNDVKYSPTVTNALKNNMNKKIINLDFTGESDLYRTLVHTLIYRPYKDRDGNIIVNIVDYYDFSDSDAHTVDGAVIGNAYKQQEKGELTNYVLLLELKYEPWEWIMLNYSW